MAIYEWSNTSLAYADYCAVSEEDDRKMQWYDDFMGIPLVSINEWIPPVLEQYLGDGKKKRKLSVIGDSPASAMMKLISERAALALSWDVCPDILHKLIAKIILRKVSFENT